MLGCLRVLAHYSMHVDYMSGCWTRGVLMSGYSESCASHASEWAHWCLAYSIHGPIPR